MCAALLSALRSIERAAMTTIRRFYCADLLKFANVNVDDLIETYVGAKLAQDILLMIISCVALSLSVIILEDITEKTHNGYFVDLFVRASNIPAIMMYQDLGYSVYRRVLRYYSGEEDGLDMRKAMARDVQKKSVIPLKRARAD